MASASSEQLGTQLMKWVQSLKDQRTESQKKYPLPSHFEKLTKLCGDRPVTIRLAKILKNSAEATQLSKNFLLAVCKESPWHLTASITPRSIRRRKMLQLAKAARKLAGRIQCYSMSCVIPGGADNLEFLTQRLGDSDLMPREDVSAVYDYELDEDGKPYAATTLSVLIESFASALDGYAQLMSRQPTHTFTRLNVYADSLAELSHAHLGRVDPVLIENIVYVITRKTFTQDAVSKRHRDKPTS